MLEKAKGTHESAVKVCELKTQTVRNPIGTLPPGWRLFFILLFIFLNLARGPRTINLLGTASDPNVEITLTITVGVIEIIVYREPNRKLSPDAQGSLRELPI